MATYHIYDGIISSGITLYDSMYISSGGIARDTNINSWNASMFISFGGVAVDTIINRGFTYIYAGGVAIDTIISDGGMYISAGGKANRATITGGEVYIYSGGTADNVTINSGGYMCISAGGTATNVSWTPFQGKIYIGDGAHVTFTSKYTGVYFGEESFSTKLLSHTQTMTSKVISSGYEMYVMDDGIANNTSIYTNGFLSIGSGGTANSTYVNGGGMFIFSGGVANNTIVSRGNIFIRSGGTANSTSLPGGSRLYGDSVGSIHIASGGVANNTLLGTLFIGGSNVFMYVSSGGIANNTTVLGSHSIHLSGGIANNTSLGGGHLYDGATYVYYGGQMDIWAEGTATKTTAESSNYIYVHSGGTARDTNMHGYMYIYSGGEHRGSLWIRTGAIVYAYSGSKIDFTVADHKETDSYLINDLSLIQGAPTYTITVSANQKSGIYKLAAGASSLTGSLTIGDGTVNYGTITVNGSDFIYNDITYSLDQINGYLTLTILPLPILTISGNPTSPTNKDVILAVSADRNCTILYQINNGEWQTYSDGITVSENGIVNIKATDSNGKVSEKSVVVDMIDKVAPTLEISGNVTAPTNQNVILTATASDGTVEYWDGAEWITGNTITATTNGTYQFRVTDAADNVTEKSVVVDMIDKVAPTIEITGNATKPTNQDVALKISANENCTILYNIDNGEWQTYSGGITVTANGTVNIKATDEAGNVTEKSVVVDKIDKKAPVFKKITLSSEDYTFDPVTVTPEITDENSITIYYQIDNGGLQKLSGTSLTVNEMSLVTFTAVDAAGNSSTLSVYAKAGYVPVSSGITSSGLQFSRGVMDVLSGGIALDTTVYSGGTLKNSGIVSGLCASSGANVYGSGLWILTQDTRIASGIAGQIQDQQYTSTRIFSGFSNFAASSGFNWLVNEQIELKDTKITSGGILSFDSGASATKINNSGTLHIGYHVNVRSTINSGCINVNSGGILVLDENRYSGVENVNFGGSSWRTVNYGTQNIYSGGIAASAAILSKGVQNIYSGATAEKTMVSSGGLQNVSGGRADYTQLLPGGSQFVFRNGLAWSTFVDRGSQHISSGGLANYTSVSHGSQYISVGGKASNTTLYGELKQYSSSITSSFNYTGDYIYWYNSGGSRCIVSSGWGENVISTTTVYWFGYTASQSVSSGGNAKNTILSSGAIQTVYNGGSALDTDVKADAFQYVLSGGEIFRSTISSGGILAVEYDGYGENINVLSGGAIGVHGVVRDLTIDKDAEFYFHMGEAVFGGYLDCYITPKSIDAISEIISFSDDLDTLYLRMDYDTDYKGSYTLSEMLPWGFDTEIIIGDFQGEYGKLTVNGNTLIRHGVEFKLTEKNNKLILTVSNDYVEPDFNSDLDGNGLADVILVHTKQGYSGAWLTTGDKSIIKWGSLSDVKAGTEILGTGRLYGTEKDGQDIFFADSKSVGAWNVVDGKVTGYKSVMSVNSTTNVLGLGDFNGDGATDLLLRSTSGDLGFYGTDGTGWEYLIGLGKEWSVAAVGDLNGDGLDDVVLRHDAGFAGTFLTQKNGTVKWANLDTLAKDMTIVGTGDFNGDGVDDVLLKNKSNGWVGAWLVEDGSVDSFIGICKNKNNIEQIADFNGDGIDDLRIRAGSDIGVLYVNGADDTTWQYFKSVGKEWDTSFPALA